MVTKPWPLMAALALFASSAFAQSNPVIGAAGMPLLTVDRQSALVEIVPPAAMEQSPAAGELIERLINKHIIQLQYPGLAGEVIKREDIAKSQFVQQKPETSADRLAAALRVRLVPQTNLIEIAVDPAVAGKDTPALAEAIVDQHMEDEKVALQNAALDRQTMLNGLKNRYQFHKDDISRDLHEKAIQLSVDGAAMPGRLNAKDLELQNLMNQSFELQQKRDDATAPDAKKVLQTQVIRMEERINIAKQDLGALTNSMNQYLTLKDDEKATVDLIRQVNQQLDKLSQGINRPSELRWVCHPMR